MATLLLGGSVGAGVRHAGRPHNQPEDVAKVRDRLVELGFDWVRTIVRGDEREFIRTIKLFQSTCAGSGTADGGDGRVDFCGNTHRWLAAENAPQWKEIFGFIGTGWQSTADFRKDNGGYCTNWLLNMLGDAGFQYQAFCILNRAPDYPPMWVRECSPVRGGDAAGHASHETGLDVDMRLPLLPPNTHLWTDLGSRGYADPRFHRSAARYQLLAINSSMNPQLVYFNDPEFIRDRLCRNYRNHDQHYHIRIRPPARVEGTYR